METLKYPIIIALDTDQFEISKKIVDHTIELSSWYKVGMQAYFSHGEKLLDYLFFKGARIFLDLKLHDIPTTVQKSLISLLKRHPVDIINIHALGGFEMMKMAKETIIQNGFSTKVIAVTILTSHDENTLQNELFINDLPEEAVNKLAKQAMEANLDGIVCSALEASNIKKFAPNDFLIITPGIRYQSSNDDQKRIATPKYAFDNGASHIVMGREITLSQNINTTLQEIKESII